MTVFRYYLSMGRLGEGGDHENGPKRCVWRRLGLSYVFFLFRVLLLLTTVFRYYLSTERRRPRKRAQTTPDASFGPFVSFFFSFLSCFIITNDCIRYYLFTGRQRP
jgi:hypothetical protein